MRPVSTMRPGVIAVDHQRVDERRPPRTAASTHRHVVTVVPPERPRAVARREVPAVGRALVGELDLEHGTRRSGLTVGAFAAVSKVKSGIGRPRVVAVTMLEDDALALVPGDVQRVTTVTRL